MSTFKTLSNRNIALITGWSIILMAVMAGLVMGMVHTPLLSSDDPSVIFENLQLHSNTFRMGILGWSIIMVTDIIAAWGLYLFFQSKNNGLSLLSGWFRLAYAGILGIAIVLLILALITSQVSNAQENTILLTKLFLGGFEATWSFGLIIFGFHLLILAYLVWTGKLILKIFSVLILIAGFGYVLTNVLNIVMADYASLKPTLEAVFMLPMVAGEVGLAIWLIVKGGK
jgi:hypothetical protein